MRNNKAVMPVLKWVGGKRQLLPKIKKYLPKKVENYYEPFLGGGAVLFELQPKKAVVNDINEELINVYLMIQNQIEELLKELSNTQKYANTSDCFYRIRELDRTPEYQKLSNVQRAARILYLNKTCYNGLYRVNNSGEFNSPFGNYRNPNIVNEFTLKAVHEYLKKADITFLNGDFAKALQHIPKNSFVYLDPPYAPISKTSNFTGYSENGFGRNEQIRLKEWIDELTKQNVEVLLSNSDCEFIRDLYQDYEIIKIKAKRSINCKGDSRGKINEVFIRNYKKLI